MNDNLQNMSMVDLFRMEAESQLAALTEGLLSLERGDTAPLEGRDGISVRNWIHLVAEAMGITAADAYLGWRNGGAPDVAAVERAGEALYQRLIEPELRKPTPISVDRSR